MSKNQKIDKDLSIKLYNLNAEILRVRKVMLDIMESIITMINSNSEKIDSIEKRLEKFTDENNNKKEEKING